MTALVLALVMLLVGPVYAYSALAGGMIAAVANALFAGRIFADYRAQEPQLLLMRLYGAELLKLVLVGVLFGGAYLWIEPLSPGALLGAFLVVYLVPPVIVASGADR
jgi:ATP synthase protein I